MNLKILLAGKLNKSNTILYWKEEEERKYEIRDYAIVENMGGYDLIEIVGIVFVDEKTAKYFSNTNYKDMKKVIKIIPKSELKNELKEEENNMKHIPSID